MKKVTAEPMGLAWNTECVHHGRAREGSTVSHPETLQLGHMGVAPPGPAWAVAGDPKTLKKTDAWELERSCHSGPWSPPTWIHSFHTFDFRV